MSAYYVGLLSGEDELRGSPGYFRRLAVFGSPFGSGVNENLVVFGQVLGYWPRATHAGLYADRTVRQPLSTVLIPEHSLAYGDRLLFDPGALGYEAELVLLREPRLTRAVTNAYRLPYYPVRHHKVYLHGAAGGGL